MGDHIPGRDLPQRRQSAVPAAQGNQLVSVTAPGNQIPRYLLSLTVSALAFACAYVVCAMFPGLLLALLRGFPGYSEDYSYTLLPAAMFVPVLPVVLAIATLGYEAFMAARVTFDGHVLSASTISGKKQFAADELGAVVPWAPLIGKPYCTIGAGKQAIAVRFADIDLGNKLGCPLNAVPLKEISSVSLPQRIVMYVAAAVLAIAVSIFAQFAIKTAWGAGIGWFVLTVVANLAPAALLLLPFFTVATVVHDDTGFTMKTMFGLGSKSYCWSDVVAIRPLCLTLPGFLLVQDKDSCRLFILNLTSMTDIKDFFARIGEKVDRRSRIRLDGAVDI